MAITKKCKKSSAFLNYVPGHEQGHAGGHDDQPQAAGRQEKHYGGELIHLTGAQRRRGPE